jgi:hypothetical protein
MILATIPKNTFSRNEDFIIGKDEFSNLQINPTKINNFYYFSDKNGGRLVMQFVLSVGKLVDYVCQVALIKKGDKFSPRLSFSVRNKNGKIAQRAKTEEETINFIKANVGLSGCHENFWKLISFLQSLKELEMPTEKFSLMSQGETEVVSALQGRDAKSIVNIIKQLSAMPGVSLSQEDLNIVIKRRGKIEEFKKALVELADDENWWQNFFEKNKWIFGYGLNYQILKQEQTQAHYGGQKLDGSGFQKGDYLTSTVGDINFTVLVEIKTPKTALLQGSSEIRNGAWSLSKNLTDAISQIEANMYTWGK